ncbi:EVE domain-containing protein [Streptococcus gordonii]|uniref:EVE domain-containing protein n=1 Tax=Streptococcus gordonii TaxID=1302 RepID=UPI000DA373B5|nr:EVE domain-containing protein [Streptococcus gordonii]QXA19168.1 EVE domain-containing protein [Streptococcus gordonii]SQG04797.1 EVE domain [Streptococcus gordonii]
MTRFWIGVVSKEHVLRGVEGGFCQLCHGKKAPLNRMKKGDYLLYYSPKYQMNDQEKLQNFTAVGKILDDTAYQVEMFEDFFPFRRDVSYYQPVIDCHIEQVRQHPQWRQYASQLRYGHFEVSKDFFLYVFDQMKVDRPTNN